jgi:(p)ppGpp synthase/HD superfamily hydrolase
MESELIKKASRFAEVAHQGQQRKYNRAPYITHPARVAFEASKLDGATEEMVAAAWLHDVVEDTTIPIETIKAEFGDNVATLVKWLTNDPKVPGENRAARKKKAAVRLAAAPREAKKIKMLDRMDNLGEMDLVQDPGFAKVYLQESWDLFYAVANADGTLAERFERTLHKMAADLEAVGKKGP